MKFKELSVNELNTAWSNTNLEELKSIKQEEKEEYIELYNVYRNLFSEYIINKLKLKEFDKKIEESNLQFSVIDEENMDIYQYFTSSELKYFYIRNNIYINRLSEKEKAFLKDIIKKDDIQLNERTTKFIEDTYKSAIYEGISDKEKRFTTFYGPDSGTYMAPNDSIIIGFRYNEFDLHGLNDEGWKNLYLEQLGFSNKVIKEMEALKTNMEMEYNIISYNNFSIIKRINAE